MTSDRDIQATVIVLQKTPYVGNKMLVYCLSPELGRMTFFVRGSENSRTTKGQAFDLFRVLAVTCHRNSSGLYYPDNVEILADYSALATDYLAYDTACRLSAFVQRNTLPNLDSARLFSSLNIAFARLAAKEILSDAAIVCCNIVFIYESGLLDYGNVNEQDRQQQEALLNMALGDPIIQLSPETWRQLRIWSESIIQNLDL